jgi:hypothetical protein
MPVPPVPARILKEVYMKKKKVLSESPNQKLSILWDGERFAITEERETTKVIVFSPVEMLRMVKFASSLGED